MVAAFHAGLFLSVVSCSIRERSPKAIPRHRTPNITVTHSPIRGVEGDDIADMNMFEKAGFIRMDQKKGTLHSIDLTILNSFYSCSLLSTQ